MPRSKTQYKANCMKCKKEIGYNATGYCVDCRKTKCPGCDRMFMQTVLQTKFCTQCNNRKKKFID